MGNYVIKASSLSTFMKRRDSKNGGAGGSEGGMAAAVASSRLSPDEGANAIISYFPPDKAESER